MSTHVAQADHAAYGLRQELEKHVVHKENFSSKSFITKKSIGKCWPDELQQLQQKIGLPWEDEVLLSILTKECRLITCILAWNSYEPFSEKLKDICSSIQATEYGQSLDTIRDSQLPLDQDRCLKIFGTSAGYLFHSTQFVFCPILISSDVKGVREVSAEARWPYAGPLKEIGSGAYGTVYEAAIVKGQLQTTKDSSNEEEVLVALKRVSRPSAWRKEVRNLDFLKESLSKHERLLLHIAAFVQGEEFLIFLPYTPYGDLETFLREGTWLDDESRECTRYDFARTFGALDRIDLAREFAAIIEATNYLHESVSSERYSPVFCAHVDLRTKNILVFPGGDENPAGIWHISDFGISSIQLGGNQALPEPVWSKYPSMSDIVEERWAPSGRQSTHPKLVGSYVAPEMSTYGIFMPRESDVWSLGCIFTEVLAFGLGTKQKGNRSGKLEDFRKQRPTWNGSGTDDYFYDRKFEPTTGTDEMQVTVSRRPKVDELLDRFHSGCDELYRLLACIIHEMLQPDPRKRCTAKLAAGSVRKACKRASTESIQMDDAITQRERMRADHWTFLVTQRTMTGDSSGRLSFLRHLQSDDSDEVPLKVHRGPSNPINGPIVDPTAHIFAGKLNAEIFDWDPVASGGCWKKQICMNSVEFKLALEDHKHVQRKIISFHSLATCLPLQASKEDFQALSNIYNIHPGFLRSLAAFGRFPDPANGFAVTPTVSRYRRPASNRHSFELWYRIQYPERNSRSKQNPWSMRHTGVYHQRDRESDFELIILIHPYRNTMLETTLSDELFSQEDSIRSRIAHDLQAIHGIVCDVYLPNWSLCIRDQSKIQEKINDNVQTSNFETGSLESDFRIAQRLRFLKSEIITKRLLCKENIAALDRLRDVFESSPSYLEWLEIKRANASAWCDSLSLLEERNQNDLELLQHAANQRDSRINQRNQAIAGKLNETLLTLTYNTVDDSATIKIITIFTLIFLPGSFIATIFGMNFFAFEDGSPVVGSSSSNGTNGTSNSDSTAWYGLTIGQNFWIFVATWLPVTALVLLIYVSMIWRRKRIVRRRRIAVQSAGQSGEV